MAAQGSVLTNKYAEGYPGRRYYGGCVNADGVEQLAIERAKALFGCEFANVQPHSGSQANQAVYLALLSPGDTYPWSGSQGRRGHLTHGASMNISGRWFDAVGYGVDPSTHLYRHGRGRAACAGTSATKLIIAGGSAYSRMPDFEAFRRDRGCKVDAIFMVDMAHFAGLVAGQGSFLAFSACACCHLHHPQDIEGAAWRHSS